MDVFVRGQAGTILQQEPLKDGSSRREDETGNAITATGTKT
jgi:hypothetical protein